VLLATIAGFCEALALDVVKEGLLFLSIDVPKAEIIFVTGDHLSVSFTAGGGSRPEPAFAFDSGNSPGSSQTDTISRNSLNDCGARNAAFSCQSHFSSRDRSCRGRKEPLDACCRRRTAGPTLEGMIERCGALVA
jgi:hypothetical protein